MNDKLQVVAGAELLSNPPATLIAQVGEKNTQVAHANQVIANTNIFLMGNTPNPANGQSEVIAQLQSYITTRSKEYYSLFVINGETFDNGRFFVPSDRALTESISKELKCQLAILDDSSKSKIKTFPSLFMSELNRNDSEQTAFYGFVTDINVQGNGIRIEFQILNSLPQHSLHGMLRELALEGKPHINELDRTHWTVKQVDLLDELRIAGFDVFGTETRESTQTL